MSLRPPTTPRASLLPQTPSSRRKSAIPERPSSALSRSQLNSLKQAINHHDPQSYQVGIAVTPEEQQTVQGRQPVQPGAARLRGSTTTTPSRSSTPSISRPKTPTGFGSSTSRFPPVDTPFSVGDEVTFEVSGESMRGTVRFIGQVDGKPGTWGGVELSEEFSGKGKNDGSVKGIQYFACPPLCGLFLPLTKIVALPKPSPPTTTTTSRASKYVGLKAKDLAATNRTESPVSPSKKPTPRRSLSPTKPRQSLSPTKPSSSTTTFATPKPPSRLSRPSIGGIATPTTARKSLSGPTGTPLASSIKRPLSSLRNHSTAPDVPPIPSAYGRTRSVTPSSMSLLNHSSSGRITPSTPGAMMRRRTSEMGSSITAAGTTRPTTPSLRSQSRQSFASSTTSSSRRAGGDMLDEVEVQELRRELEGMRVLLDGSEKLGREMEDRLEESIKSARESEERAASVEEELRKLKEREEERLIKTTEASDGDQDRLRVIELERQVEQQVQQLSKLKLESSHKSAAKEAEVESLRERLERTTKEHEEERIDLNQQIDKLRNAGQALCETYEEKIAEIELARLEALELVETLQSQSATSRSTSPTLHRSTSTNLSASSSSVAAAIDAENAQADLEHLRSRVARLEEQLEEARLNLEIEVEQARDRRTRSGEVEATLRNEIKQLKLTIDRSTQAEARSVARIKELQVALDESQATLETERNELEGLRHEANGGGASSLAATEDFKRVSRELAAAKSDFASLQNESLKNSRLVDELRQDLRTAEKEIERLQRFDANERRGSVASSIAGKDEMTSAKDQIVGLKSIVSTLTEENQQLLERSKSLEDDSTELRSTQQALEATVENLMNELSSSSLPDRSPSEAQDTLRRELEQLKVELRETRLNSERDNKALNQEIAELEQLLESKIYREDELETELERYKALDKRSSTTTASIPSQSSASTNGRKDDEEGSCEMCGGVGHDLDSCPEFLGSSSPSKRQSQSSVASSNNSLSRSQTASALSAQDGNEDWCDDCEEFGHSLDNCPLAAEIF